MLSEEVYYISNVSQTGPGAEPPTAEAPSRWAIFLNFLKKKVYFNTIESHFARIQSHLKVLDF